MQGAQFHGVNKTIGCDDLVAGINKKIDPWLEKNPLGKGGKMAAGAALGALTLGSFGMLAPVVGVGMLPALAVSSGNAKVVL